MDNEILIDKKEIKIWVVWYHFDEYNCSKCVKVKNVDWEQLKEKLIHNSWKLKNERILNNEDYEYLTYSDIPDLFEVSLADEYDKEEITVNDWDGFKEWFKNWAWDIFKM